ncbi:MAG TPA: hypothetical protein VMW24_17615 [Sedimentisphaerales bacterium]|nr:hypothetical protein [Sedimentisphaerales bacterium]
MSDEHKKQDSPLVKLMQARLKAAELRVRAAHQSSAGYQRQAANPVYDGQEAVCMGKAAQVDALSAKSSAQADLIDAEADAEYTAATGKEAPPKC